MFSEMLPDGSSSGEQGASTSMATFYALFAVMFVLVGVSFYLSARILSILKERYPEIWNELGRPSLFLNNSIQNSSNLRAFLRSPRATALADGQLDRLIVASRWVVRVYFVVFPAAIIAMFAGQYFQSRS
jgi:hypothetical protein